MPKSSYAQEVGTWDALAAALAKRGEEMPHLAEQCARLAEVVAEIKALDVRLSRETGRMRRTARELREARGVGRELESRLRAGLKQHFGAHGDGLIAFGSRPLRRPRRAEVASIERPPGEPEGGGSPN
ncbi:MAG TPA: hypothetical protein VOA87_00885 [Thermoanaerobaculia bacterium]|nr:hypothetical protein [Thermoanaerobaculia bacterium]